MTGNAAPRILLVNPNSSVACSAGIDTAVAGFRRPGGPAIETEAKAGDPHRFRLPRPLLNRPRGHMSFSGLKTAVLRVRDDLVAEKGGITVQDRADIAAGFQAAVTDVLIGKSRFALDEYLALSPDEPAFAVAGGVAANMSIRSGLETVCAEKTVRFTAPPVVWLFRKTTALLSRYGI